MTIRVAEKRINSVGIDIGTSTSHLIFSELVLKRDPSSTTEKFFVAERIINYRSKIIFTPLLSTREIDIDKFLGENIEKIKKAREIVQSYEKTEKQGRGKYTRYSEGYKSAYRMELLQPPAKDVEALRKYKKQELEAFNLYLEAYLDSLYKLTPEKNIISSNEKKFGEFFDLLKTKDFAAKMGKRIFKGDFQNYFFDGFWKAK